MAGGGVRGGQTIGATDDLGLYAVKDKLHVHDLHATILHLLGMDHTKVIYPHQGRPERIDHERGAGVHEDRRLTLAEVEPALRAGFRSSVVRH